MSLLCLKTTYSRLIYLLLSANRFKAEHIYEVDKLKKVLEVPQSLWIYSNFKMRVLMASIKDINTFTDLKVSIVEHKTSRTVTSISFMVKPKKDRLTLLSGIKMKLHKEEVLDSG